MGALEAKKQSMLSGLPLEGCENFDSACSQYASKLEVVVPQRKALGIQPEIGEAEEYSYKTSSAFWMPRVGKAWESYLYKHAHDDTIGKVKRSLKM